MDHGKFSIWASCLWVCRREEHNISGYISKFDGKKVSGSNGLRYFTIFPYELKWVSTSSKTCLLFTTTVKKNSKLLLLAHVLNFIVLQCITISSYPTINKTLLILCTRQIVDAIESIIRTCQINQLLHSFYEGTFLFWGTFEIMRQTSPLVCPTWTKYNKKTKICYSEIHLVVCISNFFSWF